jgi:hypothetical protein
MDNAMAHKFMIGQTVGLMARTLRPAAVGGYEIRRLMPAADSDPTDPRYRIKSVDENYERVALESELTQTAHPVFR